MRVYKRRYGKFAGNYNIYESVEEFQKAHPDTNFKIWNVDDPSMYQAGDWVEAEDGYITNVIAVHKSSAKRDSIYPTYFIRFPMAVFRCYMRKEKGWRIPCFYAMFTHPTKYNLSSPYYPELDNNKILFVALILAGVSPYDAVKRAFNMKGSYTIGQLTLKLKKLFTDQFVQDELMKVITGIGQKFRETFTEEQFAQRILDHLEATKKGSSQEFNALFFIGKTADYIEPSEGSKVARLGPGRQAEDAQFEDDNEPPPLPE